MVLQGGLGNFLQLVGVQPFFEAERFVGWEVVDLRPPELWADVDLRLGDVVTGINGMPIERDHEAFAAFESLQQADELRVAVLRNGQGHELVFAIEPRPQATPTKKPVSGTKPGSASSAKPASPAPTATSAGSTAPGAH